MSVVLFQLVQCDHHLGLSGGRPISTRELLWIVGYKKDSDSDTVEEKVQYVCVRSESWASSMNQVFVAEVNAWSAGLLQQFFFLSSISDHFHLYHLYECNALCVKNVERLITVWWSKAWDDVFTLYLVKWSILDVQFKTTESCSSGASMSGVDILFCICNSCENLCRSSEHFRADEGFLHLSHQWGRKPSQHNVRLWISVLLWWKERATRSRTFSSLSCLWRRRKPTFWGRNSFLYFLLWPLFKLSVYVKDWAADCSIDLLQCWSPAASTSCSVDLLQHWSIDLLRRRSAASIYCSIDQSPTALISCSVDLLISCSIILLQHQSAASISRSIDLLQHWSAASISCSVNLLQRRALAADFPQRLSKIAHWKKGAKDSPIFALASCPNTSGHKHVYLECVFPPDGNVFLTCQRLLSVTQ